MKTFLSIGAGPGIGLETAERFGREGFQIVLSARNLAKTQDLAEQLTVKGLKAEARHVDAFDSSRVAGLVESVEREFGGVEVLHYNAASMRQATLADQSRDTFNSDLAINIGGAMVAAQAVLSGMAERRSGTILLTGGGFAVQPHPKFLSLSIGKAGLRALVQGLFESFKEKGIHIAIVTVAGYVLPGSNEARSVGEQFWRLHAQPMDSWEMEAVYPSQG